MHRRCLTAPLERLLGGGNHEQAIEAQRLAGILRDEHVAHMRRIEAAAEEPEAHGRVGQRAVGPGRAKSAGVRAVTVAGPEASGEVTPTFFAAVSLGAAPHASVTAASPG